MNLEILTRDDMMNFKSELLEEIRRLIQPKVENTKWLKSSDVRKMLNCSSGTLQNLRINGVLPFTKVGGTLYYDYDDVTGIMNDNKRNVN